MVKERYQNPRVGDDLRLRMLVFNGSQPTDVNVVEKVEIWKLDNTDPNDVKKRTLAQTIDGSSIAHDGPGSYSAEITLEDGLYSVGRYIDVWYLGFEEQETNQCQIATVANEFKIVRDLWFTSPSPVIFDFTFSFRPNRLRQGSRQFLLINVKPNTPTAGDMEAYYRNMTTVSPLYISIAQRCGECVPEEQDLRLIVDKQLVEFREQCLGYYLLDTSSLDPGIYDVWFQLELAGNIYISPTNQLEVFV